LLRCLFSETLSSHRGTISQYTIAFDCYGLVEKFDPAANTLIRSHAGRLRRLLKDLAPPEDGVRILMKVKIYQLYFELAGEPGVQGTVPAQSPTLGVLEFDEMVGDWGALSKHTTRNALSRSGELFPVHEAVMLARQYLTHFNFEYLGRCVQTLRETAVNTEDAAIPATLAVLLSSACSVEPRWIEPMDREQIHQLAARAARLGPEDPCTRLALALVAFAADDIATTMAELARFGVPWGRAFPLVAGACAAIEGNAVMAQSE
jgi:hypothetical protein